MQMIDKKDLPAELPASDHGDDLDLGTVAEACRVVGGQNSPIDRATYYRGVKKGLYTAPIRVSPNISRVPLKKLRERLRAIIDSADNKTSR